MDEAVSKEALPYVYLWMPALYGTGMKVAHEKSFPMVWRLWPGLPADAACEAENDGAGNAMYQPESLPYTPAQMRDCLRELESFSADLARGRDNVQAMVAARAEHAHEAGIRKELDEVEALGGSSAMPASVPDEEACKKQRERAQRLLAWFWYQQKTLADIDNLVARVNKDVPGLGSDLRYDKDEEQEALDAGVIPLFEELEEDSAKADTNWRLWLEAALALVPENTVFVWTRLPEDLEDVPFSAQEDFAQCLPCPEGFACEGAGLKAADLLPGIPGVFQERTVRFVRLAMPASR